MTSTRPPGVVLADLDAACRVLHERGAGLLRWEWDDHVGAALAVTQDPQHHDVLTLLAQTFVATWDATNIGDAPPRIVELSGACRGLRAGQLLLARDAAEDPLLFALWWPWGSGTRFSLRIGCVAHGAEAQALNPLGVVRAALGVAA